MKPGIIILFIFLYTAISCGGKKEKPDDRIIEIPEYNNKFKRSLIEDLKKEIGENSENPDLYLKKSYFEEELENWNEAVNDLRKAKDLDPGNINIHFRLGKVLSKAGKTDEAFRMLGYVYNQDPAYPGILPLMVESYFLQGDYHKAYELADEVLESDLNNPDLLYTFAGLNLKNGDTVKAVKLFNKVLELDSSYWKAYLKISELLVNNEKERSDRYLTKAYLLNPRNPQINVLYSRLLVSSEDYDSALSVLKKAISSYENEELLLELTRTFYHRNFADSALIYAERLINKYESPEGKLIKARVMDKKRNYNTAVKLYNEIIDQDSTHKIAIEELDILERKIAYLRRLEQQRKDTLNIKGDSAEIE